METKISNNDILSTIRDATADQKPIIELTKEQRDAIKTVAGAALAVIAVAGVITIAAMAPNIFKAVHQIHRYTKGKKYTFKEKQKKTAQTFYYLKRQGLIQITQEKKGLVARLTEKGKEKIQKLNMDTLRVKSTKNWNGRWWMVAADIPTKDYRWAADLLRKKIKQMQFYPLQRTLWFYPYDPTSEIEFLANHYGIGQFVTAMEISRMDKDDEQKLKKFYNL